MFNTKAIVATRTNCLRVDEPTRIVFKIELPNGDEISMLIEHLFLRDDESMGAINTYQGSGAQVMLYKADGDGEPIDMVRAVELLAQNLVPYRDVCSNTSMLGKGS